MKATRPSQPFWLLLPMLAALATFFVYPLLSALYTSFWEWDLLTPPRFVGLAKVEARHAQRYDDALGARTKGDRAAE